MFVENKEKNKDDLLDEKRAHESSMSISARPLQSVSLLTHKEVEITKKNKKDGKIVSRNTVLAGTPRTIRASLFEKRRLSK